MGGYELLLIALVGIVVLGPEKMPKAIRSVYRFIRGVRQFADSVTSELDEELRIKELHNNLKQAEQQGFKNLSPEVQASVEELQRAADSVREGYKTPNTIAMPNMLKPEQDTCTSNAQVDSEAESSVAIEANSNASIDEQVDNNTSSASTTPLEPLTQPATNSDESTTPDREHPTK